jgi:hypothetical protein
MENMKGAIRLLRGMGVISYVVAKYMPAFMMQLERTKTPACCCNNIVKRSDQGVRLLPISAGQAMRSNDRTAKLQLSCWMKYHGHGRRAFSIVKNYNEYKNDE